jgi:hypothetical protein
MTDISKLREYGSEDSKTCKALIKLLDRVQVYVPDEKIAVVYPKRLFGNSTDKQWDGTDLEIVLLTVDGQIVITKFDDKQGFIINIYQKSEIASITISGNIVKSDYEVNPRAVLKFKDGNELVLSSSDDANEYWVMKYAAVITKFIKSLF